jgi:hypothetical protein
MMMMMLLFLLLLFLLVLVRFIEPCIGFAFNTHFHRRRDVLQHGVGRRNAAAAAAIVATMVVASKAASRGRVASQAASRGRVASKAACIGWRVTMMMASMNDLSIIVIMMLIMRSAMVLVVY